MKKNSFAIILTLILTVMSLMIPGCGNKDSDTKDAQDEKTEDQTESSDNDGKDEEDQKDEAEADQKEEDQEDEADDKSDDKDSSKSAPSSLYFLTKDMYIEDMLDKYAVNLNEQEYTGDIGDLIPDYKDVDLDGDGTADIIERYGDDDGGFGYRIEFSGGGNIDTGAFSSSPNEGEVIEFLDMDKDNVDEILINHITLSTGGPMCWQTYLYAKNDKGKWKGYPIIDEDNKLYSSGLEDMIKDRSGMSYYDSMIRFADIELTEDGIAMLADFGMKEGSNQVYDYEGVLLERDPKLIKSGKGEDRDALEYLGSSKENAEKYWPKDAEKASGSDASGEEGVGEETIPEYFEYVTSPDGYANLRSGPGTEYDIICRVPTGEALEVYRGGATDTKGKTWHKVAYWTDDEELREKYGDGGWFISGWIAVSELD